MSLEELKEKHAEISKDLDQFRAALQKARDDWKFAERGFNDQIQSATREWFEVGRKIAELEAPPVDRSNLCTLHGTDPAKISEVQTETEGQHKDYLVLCEEERAKGFVRPVRRSYRHVGKKLRGRLDEVTPPYESNGKIFPFIDHFDIGEGKEAGTYLTANEADSIRRTGFYGGCGSVTTMGTALAETYARDPKFYGATMCVHCNKHLPVGEFVWDGTDEVLGS